MPNFHAGCAKIRPSGKQWARYKFLKGGGSGLTRVRRKSKKPYLGERRKRPLPTQLSPYAPLDQLTGSGRLPNYMSGCLSKVFPRFSSAYRRTEKQSPNNDRAPDEPGGMGATTSFPVVGNAR